MKLLAGYHGIVQCDGYAAYKQVAHDGRAGNAVTLAFCWSHWRRRFYEIAKPDRHRSPRKRCGGLPGSTGSRTKIRGKTAAERRAVRQAESRPLVEPEGLAEINSPASPANRRLPRRSATASTIGTDWCAFSQMAGSRSTPTPWSAQSDRLPKPQERAVRRPRPRRGQLGCRASLIETCKLNGVDPQAYIKDVLTKLVNLWPASRIEELMPWAWAGTEQH